MATRCLIVIMMFTLLLLLPISCINVPNPTPTPATPTQSLMTYENSAYGVKINYPQDWTKQEFTLGNTIVVFTRPMESITDIPGEDVKLGVLDFSAKPMTLDEYTQVKIQRLGQIMPNSKIIDSTPTTLAGYPAQKMAYTMKIGQSDIKGLDVYTIKNNKAYIISYLAQSSRYSDFIGIVQQMIDSFEITSSTGK